MLSPGLGLGLVQGVLASSRLHDQVWIGKCDCRTTGRRSPRPMWYLDQCSVAIQRYIASGFNKGVEV
jgi:hypothetical protein